MMGCSSRNRYNIEFVFQMIYLLTLIKDAWSRIRDWKQLFERKGVKMARILLGRRLQFLTQLANYIRVNNPRLRPKAPIIGGDCYHVLEYAISAKLIIPCALVKDNQPLTVGLVFFGTIFSVFPFHRELRRRMVYSNSDAAEYYQICSLRSINSEISHDAANP